ncbi:ABC transporter substrate-binding protein [Vibrio nomapromontoriensis]|uniref:ABC transporter substrate-binding protein n=1 Tax=Vibrio nomapromontoriensis TaxID=2910246 RepID=UPI003D1152EC
MNIKLLFPTIFFPSLLSISVANALPEGASRLPEAPIIPNRLEIRQFTPQQLMQVKALDGYSEPGWVTEKYVNKGLLPPVQARLPDKPIVMMSESMPDGIGEYGGVFRHAIGGRPQGWNWTAAQSQGWGGINYTMQQCLTSTGPMYQLKGENAEVLPNLATSWQWSEDKMSLTMNLLKGAKWSDGHPFTSEDIRFYWEDTVLEKRIPSFSGADAIGVGAKLELLDDYTIRWHFQQPNQNQALYNMSFMTFCPGPAHILKAYHPKYTPDKTFDDFNKALPANELPAVTMGPWVPTETKTDEIIVMRRNPYYWKVDEKGQQLPYMDEMHFNLGTWEGRTVQTLAGTADFANMENPPIYLETLRKLSGKDAKATAMFGPRNLSYAIQLNQNPLLSAKDDRQKAIRGLNRQLKFRKAISHAVDRKSIGQALVKGPFTAEYAGGFHPETSYFDADSVAYFGYNQELAKQYLSELGLKDTDDNGILNFTQGPAKGQDLEVVISTGPTGSDTVMLENLTSMLGEVGIKVIPRPLENVQFDAERDQGAFDWRIQRGEKELVIPFQRVEWVAPVAATGPIWHRGTSNAPQQLQPFEKQLAKLALAFSSEQDKVKQKLLISSFNQLFTENVYHVGLIAYPGALLVNTRLKNIPNAPILAYQWAEDAVMRERVWVTKSDQIAELQPEYLPSVD